MIDYLNAGGGLKLETRECSSYGNLDMKIDPTRSLEFRGVQLDLARQPETIEYIFAFIDFASRYRYNYLVLYLEGRIKTKSFPYLSEEESYTPDEIKKIVAYARERGMETVPVVSLFGHANLFLNCLELGHLAELRDDRKGRFSYAKHVFCPSLQETRDFLESYVTEVSELFPSKYFHAGFDEAWDIGYCDCCRDRLKSETQSDIYLQHLQFCHDIVSRKLNKRMMIWDDLFDIYPEALQETPRNIVLCSWHYDKLVERPAGHCGGPREDHFEMYDRMGFQYIFAPACVSIRNIETFSAYSLQKNPLGGLLTVWELERRFLFSEYPSIAYAGLAWSGGVQGLSAEKLQDYAIRDVTQCESDALVYILKWFLNSQDTELSPARQTYLKGPLSNEEYDRKLFIDIANAVLSQHSAPVSGGYLSANVMEDTLIDIEVEAVYFQLRELICALYEEVITPLGDGRLERRAEDCLQRIASIRSKRREQWKRHRPGLTSHQFETYLDQAVTMLTASVDDARMAKSLLRVRFAAGEANIALSLRYLGGDAWDKVVSGFYVSSSSEVTYLFPLYSGELPEAILIEVWGYVGLGVVFVELESADARFVPLSVEATDGFVINPSALLEDGRDSCYLGQGEQIARQKFRDPRLADIKSSIQIAFHSVSHLPFG